jgi:hypothetical protein
MMRKCLPFAQARKKQFRALKPSVRGEAPNNRAAFTTLSQHSRRSQLSERGAAATECSRYLLTSDHTDKTDYTDKGISVSSVFSKPI